MASTSKSEISLWFIRPTKGGIKRVKVSKKALYGVAALVGVLLGGVFFFVGDYARFINEEAATYQEFLSLVKQKEKLKSEKVKLEQEIAFLKSQTSIEQNFQKNLKSKMDELHAVIESSTGLGLFSQTAQSQLGQGPAAAPKLGRRLRDLNKALGGAEIECRRGASGKLACISSGEKQETPLDEMRASLKPRSFAAPADVSMNNARELESRIRKYLELLRRLPVGVPVRGEITSGYGYRQSPFSGHSSFHQGIDISIPEGAKVMATGDGVVTRAEYHSTYGWLVEVDHYDGITTRYAHLSKPTVIVDQLVPRGSTIGLSGCSGRSTGPHVHYEVLVRGRPRNPNTFLQLASKLRRFL